VLISVKLNLLALSTARLPQSDFRDIPGSVIQQLISGPASVSDWRCVPFSDV
jgi:hypothetical protein